MEPAVPKRLLPMVILLTVALVAAALVFEAGGSSGAPAPISVYPQQGTYAASPKTQISFRGAASSGLGGIVVTGSKTGRHTGVLKDHSDGQGASFLLDSPFAPGEQVTVKADQPLVGAVGGAVRFGILTPPAKPHKPELLADPGGHPNVPQFHSRPDIQAPGLQVLKNAPAAAPGDIFLGAKAGPGQDGVAIYQPNGTLVWFHKMPSHVSAFDFRVQQYQGQPVLTWWQGTAIFPGEGLGVGMIYDSTYRPIATVKAGNGYAADLHEFQLTPQGTAFVLAYQPVMANLQPAHGARHAVALDNVVQEIDIKTGLVEREWHSLGRVSVSKAAVKPAKNIPFDAFHVNAIEQEADGNWLVSSRNTNAAYEIDSSTGKVLWQLGGKGSTFRMGPGAQFLGQHDVRRAPSGNITLFDNGTFGIKAGRASRALELKVDQKARTANIVHAFEHRNPVERTFSQGSVRTLPNGDLFVGWGGANAYVTEFSSTGEVVWDALMHPTGDDTYRAFKFEWSGALPAESPRPVATTSGGSTTVWMSWNGATELAGWRVLAGPDPGSLTTVAEVSSAGFETGVTIGGAPAFVKVQALDSTKKIIANSQVVKPGTQ
jgi:hypothetical protein